MTTRKLKTTCEMCTCGLYYISIGSAGPDSSKLLGRNCGHLVCDHPSWVEPWCLGIVHTYLVERVELLWSSQRASVRSVTRRYRRENVVEDGRGGDHKVAPDPHFRSREEGGFSHLRKGTSQRESERSRMPPVSVQPHSAPSFSFLGPSPPQAFGVKVQGLCVRSSPLK